VITILAVLVFAAPPDSGGAAPAVAGGPERRAPGAIGLAAPVTAPPPGFHCEGPGPACYILIPVGVTELESPERLDPALETAAAAGLRVIVRLTGEGIVPEAGAPTEPSDAQDRFTAAVGAWAARVGGLARHAGHRVSAYQVLDETATRLTPHAYAFLLKEAAVMVRSARSGLLVVAPPIRPDGTAWMRAVLAADAAPYLDVLAACGAGSLPALLELRDTGHPRAAAWVTDESLGPEARPWIATRAWLESMEAGADAVILDDGQDGDSGIGAALSWLRDVLPPGAAPTAIAALPIEFTPPAGGGPPASIFVFDPVEREGLLAYRAAGEAGPPAAGAPVLPVPPTIRFIVRTPLDWLDLLDPARLVRRRLAEPVVTGAVAEVGLRDHYLMLRFRIATSAVPLQESERVGAAADLSAAEIIARERTVAAAQGARLRNYRAGATVSLHYRIASLAQSVDVTTENRVYVHGGAQDYEQLELYLDGARWRGKTPPHLPFIQPDKVSEVPLDIALDEAYRYQLAGRDHFEGRDCYVLEFAPVEEGQTLYRGRVWIDAATFARVRMDAVQEGVKQPVRSNQVDYRFGEVRGPDGPYRLPVEVLGQMTFEVVGFNLVVERRVRFHDFAVNPDDFESSLRAAHASGRALFRETAGGYFRLDPSGGVESLASASTLRNAFLLAGISIGVEGDPGFPFAGVNFFDFDFRGSGTQFNLAWAGPYVDISWTHPEFARPREGRRPLALTLQGSFNAFAERDKVAHLLDTPRNEYVDVYTETMRAELAVPLGHHLRGTVEARATWLGFTEHHDTDPAFVLPSSTLERAGLLRLEWSRKGWLADAWAESSRRGRWEPWGLPGTPFSREDRDFTRRGAELRKTFHPGPFHKIGFGISGFDGRGLDRFSRFQLGDFRSARVRGFNGSGIHFDRGVVARAEYSFSLGTALRIDLALEHGWLRGEEDFGPDTQRVLGAGAGVQFSGPWSTLVVVRTSYGIDSTLADKGGGGDVRIVFLRTFDRWGRRKPAQSATP
jgi:hypothetical protein